VIDRDLFNRELDQERRDVVELEAMRRQNRGKLNATELANEKQRTQLRQHISALHARWAIEDAAEPRVKADRENNMTTNDQKTKLFKLTYRELRHSFFNQVAEFPKALAKVVAARPEFSNIKSEVASEFINDTASGPTPELFRQEVAVAQKANGGDYDLAFQATFQKYPAMQRRIAFQNEEQAEELADSGKAGKEFSELLNAWFNNHPTRNRNLQSDYNIGYYATAQAHPEVMSRMIKPRTGPTNLWRQTRSDGHTPSRSPAPKTADLKYGPGVPNRRLDEAKALTS
jgi:hypothetical protein